MSFAAGTSNAMTAHRAVEDRCAEIGLPVLHTDAKGRVTRCAWPSGGELGQKALRQIVESPRFARAVVDSAGAWHDEYQPDACEVINGWTLLPLPVSEKRARIGYVCVLLLDSSGTKGEHFASLCQSAGVDAELVAELFATIALGSTEGAKRFATLVRYSHSDLVELASAEVAIEGFSAQLAESYEEISLLYSIGRAMKELVSAEAFVMHLCERMHETLPYRWIALRFLHTVRASKQLSGRTFIEGSSDFLELEGELLLGEITRRVTDSEKNDTIVFSAGDDGPEVLCHAISRDGETVGVVIAGEKNGDDTAVSSVDMKLVDGSARLAEVAIANIALYEEQQSFFLGTLEALTSAIDAKDPYTCGHSQRVSELSVRLARLAGLSATECETVRISGLVHDLGKIGVPEQVLLKTSRLTDEEFGLIKLHPEIGHRILRGIPMFDEALPGVLHHHERWDGRGYPIGLAGEDIPLIARIIGVADAFDAMSSSRTYRAAMPRHKVLSEIRDNAGAQFDPELAPLFLTIDLAFYDEMLADIAPQRPSEAA